MSSSQVSPSQKSTNFPDGQVAYDLIILGSGIAGLAAASLAQKDGKSVLVVDKGKHLGGRVSARLKSGFLFNHGAQFFTARGNNFSTLLRDARSAGIIKDWKINPTKIVQIGTSSMCDLPQFMARGIELRQQTEVTSISNIGPHIGFFRNANLIALGRQAIISAPAPQTSRLLTDVYPKLAATADFASYDPCWTIMLSLETDLVSVGRSQDRFFPLRDEAAGISFAVPENMRFLGNPAPNTTSSAALTIQASGRWSKQHLDEDPQIVIARLCTMWESIALQTIPPILEANAHRWLYAKVTRAADDSASRHSDDGKIAIAGDWLGGPRVEQAFDSGIAAYVGLC